MRSRAITLCLCLGVSSLTSWLHAEEPEPLSPGMRLRVTAPAQTPKRIVGTLTGVDTSFLTIQTSDKQIAVRREAIHAVEISERRSWKKRGALIGAGLGVLAAIVIGATANDTPYESCFLTCTTVTPSPSSDAMLAAIMFVPVGAGLGAAVSPGERWVVAKTPILAIGPTQAQGGLRVGISIRF